MAKPKFTNGRDAESQLAFILNISQYVGRYTNLFSTENEIVEVPLDLNQQHRDRYAIFLPSAGANFVVAGSQIIPAFPDVGNGNPMQVYNGVINPAAIDLVNSQFDELWIKNVSTNPFVLTVLIYS